MPKADAAARVRLVVRVSDSESESGLARVRQITLRGLPAGRVATATGSAAFKLMRVALIDTRETFKLSLMKVKLTCSCNELGVLL